MEAIFLRLSIYNSSLLLFMINLLFFFLSSKYKNYLNLIRITLENSACWQERIKYFPVFITHFSPFYRILIVWCREQQQQLRRECLLLGLFSLFVPTLFNIKIERCCSRYSLQKFFFMIPLLHWEFTAIMKLLRKNCILYFEKSKNWVFFYSLVQCSAKIFAWRHPWHLKRTLATPSDIEIGKSGALNEYSRNLATPKKIHAIPQGVTTPSLRNTGLVQL